MGTELCFLGCFQDISSLCFQKLTPMHLGMDINCGVAFLPLGDSGRPDSSLGLFRYIPMQRERNASLLPGVGEVRAPTWPPLTPWGESLLGPAGMEVEAPNWVFSDTTPAGR